VGCLNKYVNGNTHVERLHKSSSNGKDGGGGGHL